LLLLLLFIIIIVIVIVIFNVIVVVVVVVIVIVIITTMARSKTWTVLDTTRTNVSWDNMMGNNSVVSEWKENFRLSQPLPSGLLSHDHCCRGNKRLVNHSIINVPGSSYGRM